MNKNAPQTQNNPNWQPLAELGFPRLLFRFAKERATGLLYLTFGEHRVTVVLFQGTPVFANSNAMQDSLGNLLVTRGVLTRAQLEEAVVQVKSAGKQLGTVLVQKKWLSQQDLLQYLREQIKAIILKVFSWEGGHYYFEVQQLASRETISLVNHPVEMIIAGVRQGFSLGRLMQEGVKQEVVFSLHAKPAAILQGLNWGPAADKILTLVDGKRSVKDLLGQSGTDALESLKAIYCLWISEKLEIQSPVAAKPNASADAETSSGPELIAPDQDARVALDDLPFQAEKDEIPKPADDFVISAQKSPVPPSAKNSAPVILGDVAELEKAYETKKKAPKKEEDPLQDLQEETLGEETLDEIVPPTGKAKTITPSDSGESTLDPKDFPKLTTQPPPVVQKQKPSEAAVKNSPPPAPLKSKPAEVAKSATAAVQEDSTTVMLAAGGWGRLMKYFVFAAVIVLLVCASLGLYVYVDPESTAKQLDRIRLLKMYGQATLDAKRLGQFYEDDGQLKQAQEAFERALQQTPHDDRLELTLARVSQRLEEWEKAKKHFEAVISRNPALTDAHLGLAWCFLREGEVVRAKREFYLYLASSPVSPQTENIRSLVQGLQ